MAAAGSFIPLLCLSIALLLLISTEPSTFVSADEALIKKLCNTYTLNSTLCNQCINSDPSSPNAGATQLTIIAFNCAKNKTLEFYETLFNYNFDIAKDPVEKSILEESYKAVITMSYTLVGEVQRKVEGKDFEGAGKFIKNTVFPTVNSCVTKYKEKGIAVPDTVDGATRDTTNIWIVVDSFLYAFLTGGV